MKILLCTQIVIKQELGAPRVLLGLAEGLKTLGWKCQVVGPEEIYRHTDEQGSGTADYAAALHTYLQEVAADYDVVDYPYDHLPYPRSEFPRKTLFVARSMLLTQHFANVRIPKVLLLRQRIKRFLTRQGKREQTAFAQALKTARITLDNADLVNVANEDDRVVLEASGIDPRKIVVIPYGLSVADTETLAQVEPPKSDRPCLCFLGTFDHRKGGADLPRLLNEVSVRVPNCQFKLIGTAGLHQSEGRVRAFFSKRLQRQLEVVPRFQRAELPSLLSGCTVGIFPSYVEGFGFAVLEMMMAGIPVVAYRSPGPTMMLPDDLLTPRGDVRIMADRVADLLLQTDERQHRAVWCQQRARELNWNAIGIETDEAYHRAIAEINVHQNA